MWKIFFLRLYPLNYNLMSHDNSNNIIYINGLIVNTIVNIISGYKNKIIFMHVHSTLIMLEL